METTAIVEEIHFDEPGDFLNYLQIRNHHWLSPSENSVEWYFRGQCDATWELIPRAWRTDSADELIVKSKEKKHKSEASRYRKQIKRAIKNFKARENSFDFTAMFQDNLLEFLIQLEAEIELVSKFIQLADAIGHPIPQISDFASKKIKWVKSTIEDMIDNFQMGQYYPILATNDANNLVRALAQHHGVPTSLLDWTRKPFVAAYFAAEKVFPNSSANNKIAVWAIRKKILLDNLGINVIECPRGHFNYLHAQDGVFTYDEGANRHFLQFGEWRSLEQAMRESVLAIDKTPLRKITLPAIKAGELLDYLWIEGISRAHLMPVYDNVTEALRLKCRWS